MSVVWCVWSRTIWKDKWAFHLDTCTMKKTHVLWKSKSQLSLVPPVGGFVPLCREGNTLLFKGWKGLAGGEPGLIFYSWCTRQVWISVQGPAMSHLLAGTAYWGVINTQKLVPAQSCVGAQGCPTCWRVPLIECPTYWGGTVQNFPALTLSIAGQPPSPLLGNLLLHRWRDTANHTHYP